MRRSFLARWGLAICTLGTVSVIGESLLAQRGATPGTESPRAGAPLDLTGYWVSVVTEDWRFRMMTPPKGDYASVPLNAEARKLADAWDPAKDEASGNACRAYGAANIMRVPGRLHITWQDDTTLKIETDAGTQTRLLHFGNAPASSGPAGWQGYSVAKWETAGPPARGGGAGAGGGAAATAAAAGAGAAAPAGGTQEASAAVAGAEQGRGRGGPPPPRFGSLAVVTTRLKPGYLRKNGIPHSENAVVTEYFDRHDETDGSQWFTVTTIVEDAKYLNQPFITSTHFKKEPDAAKWSPAPCSAR